MIAPAEVSAQAAALSAQASTLSAHVAEAVAVVVAVGALLQFFVGYRQTKAALIAAGAAQTTAERAGRYKVAEFRQKWIEMVRDLIAEHQSILLGLGDSESLVPQDERRLNVLKTKLELLLNPEEQASRQLMEHLNEMRCGDSVDQRMQRDFEISELAHKILKTEWIRINKELA